ncbi:MAG: hypothetical protein K9H64_08025 [Bacteroidales bacterium]|nr:hypothetical protein [Bacteroidales bacterium]MCF8455709.1 hypothetical protein [Bacteroidales bacterium]
MWFKIIVILLFLHGSCEFATAQEEPAKKDSTLFYKNLETYSKRSELKSIAYRIFLKPVIKRQSKRKVYRKLIHNSYKAFEGKVIRKIYINPMDPFGYSVNDPMDTSRYFLTVIGNKLHIQSQTITIRNLLLIRQNQVFDSLLVRESERLVRSRDYVKDVSFFIIPVSENSDSVDIFIRELDRWSILPAQGFSTSSMTFGLMDKNFSGLGHESQNRFTWHPSTGDLAFDIKYTIPNFRNTYIGTTLQYRKDEYGNYIRSLGFDRPFFSPFAKWAAGVNFSQQFQQHFNLSNDSLIELQTSKYNTQDFWAGNAMQLFKGTSELTRTTNFISTLRFLRIRYLEKPIEKTDPGHLFLNEDFYLLSFGISSRRYVRDKFIFKYGVTEDVPIGKVYNLTAGYQIKNNISRVYLAARMSLGHYYPWGYLTYNVEYGTFFRAASMQQGAFGVNVNYITGLIEVGNWKFRQFIKQQLTIGINRFPTDSLTLNDGYGLDGFNSPDLSGNSRLILTLQAQSYTPWNIIGFRFGPYITYSLGMLGDAPTGFKNSKMYSQFGLGVLVKNENLVFNAFQVSIAFYPIIPGLGHNLFKPNSYKTTEFGFSDFEIGKPATVVYQ